MMSIVIVSLSKVNSSPSFNEMNSLLSKLLMTGFLNLLVFKPTSEWLSKSIIYICAIVLMNYVIYGNDLEKMILNSEYLMILFRITILIWIGYILYLILLSYK